MSDAAFKTAAFPGYTTQSLRDRASGAPEGIRRAAEFITTLNANWHRSRASRQKQDHSRADRDLVGTSAAMIIGDDVEPT